MQAEAAEKSAQAQITQARAALNQNEVTLGHTIIRAPIDGIVISRSVDVGQTVAASMQAPTLFVIAQDLTRMQVRASIDEADIGRIRAGQQVSFRVDAYPSETFTGEVAQVRLEPTTEQNVVSYTTIINVPNPGLTLKPGMTATVAVHVASNTDVLRVPNSALRFRPTGDVLVVDRSSAPASAAPGGQPIREAGLGRVWILRDGGVQEARVRTGVTDGAVTAVLEGDLREGDQVVTGVADQAASAAPPATGSPLLPFGGRGPGAGRQGGAAQGARARGAQ